MNLNYDQVLSAGVYTSPKITVVEIKPEGLLCVSGMTEDYNYREFEW